MPQNVTVVDAFTDRPLEGNPAAVCVLDREHDPDWMQGVAREMKHSETAFLLPGEDGYSLRWFTPKVEVDLCGHATLAAAHVLWESGRLGPEDPARFHTRSGLLTCRRAGGMIEMNLPATPEQPCPQPEGISRALGAAPRYLGSNGFDLLMEVENEDALRKLRPDFRRVAGLAPRGVIVTARADSPEADFVSRFFAPAAGVDEDPVTGSAHCTLGPYWAERLGKNELVGYQCSRRGGTVRVRVEGDRVVLIGTAVTVLRGDLFL